MIHIRNATPDDAKDLVRLIHELAAAGGETSSLSEAYAVRYLLSPENQVLLAEVNGRVAGLISFSMHPNLYHAGECCMIDELVVQQGLRDQGVGGALLEAVIECAIQGGCAEVSVSTLPDNHRAQEFYHQHGLVEEALLLEKHLRV